MTDVLERVKTYQQFIGGEWVDSASGETLDVENPADGEVIAKVQASGAEDVDRAANAAATVFETWRHTTPAERSGMLLAGRGMRVAKAIQFGTVWINDHFMLVSEMPHGGFKESGYGKDQSMYAIEDYTVVKHVMLKI